MKQYRFTSSNFVPQGETGDPDAVMDAQDLNDLKRLAGMPVLEDAGGNGAGPVGGNLDNVPQAQDTGIQSPVGSTQLTLAKDRKLLEKEYAVQPGTDLWFLINFTQPKENGKELRQYVEEYLNKHPEYRPKLPSGS
jgi:hypothetical protein